MPETSRDMGIRKQIGAVKQARDDAIWNEAIEAAAKHVDRNPILPWLAEEIRALKREPKP